MSILTSVYSRGKMDFEFAYFTNVKHKGTAQTSQQCLSSIQQHKLGYRVSGKVYCISTRVPSQVEGISAAQETSLY